MIINTIIYLIKLKFKLFFIKKKTAVLTNIFYLVLLFSVIFNGILFSIIINKLEEINKLPYNFKNYSYLIIILIICIRNIFPVYKPFQDYFPKYYNINIIEKIVYKSIYDIFSPFFILLFVFYCIIIFLSKPFFVNDFILFSIILITGYFFELIIKILIEHSFNKFRKKALITFVLLLFTIIYICTLLFLNNSFETTFIIFLSFLLSVTIILFYCYKFKEVKSYRIKDKLQTNNNLFNYLIKESFRNKKIRISFFFGLIFKMLLVIVSLFILKKKGHALYNSEFILWLFSSPLIYFTYVLNNIWGYSKNMWLRIQYSSNSFNNFLLIYTIKFSLIIFIDFVITISVFIFLTEKNIILDFIYYYLNLSVILYFIGFFNSWFLPVNIINVFSLDKFNNNTSTGASLITITLFVILFFLPKTIGLSICYFVVFISYLFVKRNKNKITERTYKIFFLNE
ncbi:MAG TPA: O-antigen polymerase [Bacteroidales bacterium]|nr:O-antigen polymerase [Bacteroidales bacterium]HPS16183.1 O-antigen polymerase [Bacteroidales bacterium]